jgi:glutaminyl-peptide cyclotransferase
MACSSGKGASAEPQPESQPTQSNPQGAPSTVRLAVHVDGAKAMDYAKRVVGFGPRWVGSPGHKKTEDLLRAQLKNDGLVEDAFTATTPAGPLQMRNYIAKFPGAKAGTVVITGHYDTLYKRNDFVGANDGGSSTALLLALADALRAESKGKPRAGYSVWLVWFDGEEAIKEWSGTDSIYGSKHLALKWKQDGTAEKINALINVDMIGDADLHVEFDSGSNGELQKVIYQAATALGYKDHFYGHTMDVGDDHLPFVHIGIPSADIIDFNYGPDNSYWHTPQDTIDKLSPESFKIVGDVVLATIGLIEKQ